VIFCLWCSY